jgi:SAM-dependent methyltransferase
MITRSDISKKYIRGHGIEIGAFHNPFPLQHGTTVTYVDTKTKEELRIAFPEINFETQFVVETDIIDDGEILGKIQNETYDFLISSHQLEHCISPLTALENQLRVVKKGGYLFYAIPNREKTFDKDRPTTSWGKLRDYYAYDFRRDRLNDHGKWTLMILDCYDEYLLNVDKIQDREERLKIGMDRIAKGLDIHFHTFTPRSTYELFFLTNFISSYEVEFFMNSGHEIFIVLRKI